MKEQLQKDFENTIKKSKFITKRYWNKKNFCFRYFI